MAMPTEQNDRRAAKRLMIERDVQYRILNRREGEMEGTGKTVNMSSSGVLFTTGEMLLPGRRLELSISWPAHLDNRCALKLMARGRVVRYEGNGVALEIMQHEFRTKSSKA
jgi:PilZ domain-containing protein